MANGFANRPPHRKPPDQTAIPATSDFIAVTAVDPSRNEDQNSFSNVRTIQQKTRQDIGSLAHRGLRPVRLDQSTLRGPGSARNRFTVRPAASSAPHERIYRETVPIIVFQLGRRFRPGPPSAQSGTDWRFLYQKSYPLRSNSCFAAATPSNRNPFKQPLRFPETYARRIANGRMGFWDPQGATSDQIDQPVGLRAPDGEYTHELPLHPDPLSRQSTRERRNADPQNFASALHNDARSGSRSCL